MSNDYEMFWNEIESESKIMTDDFLSSVEDSFDCSCRVCSVSDAEKNWASEQVNKWINRFA